MHDRKTAGYANYFKGSENSAVHHFQPILLQLPARANIAPRLQLLHSAVFRKMKVAKFICSLAASEASRTCTYLILARDGWPSGS